MSSSSSSATDVPDVEMDDPEIVIDSDIESSEDEAEEDYHGLAEEAAAEDLEPERQDLGPADGIVQVPVTRVSIEHLENNVNQKLEHQLEPFTTRNIKVDLGEQKYERNLDPPFRLGGACYIDFVFIKGVPGSNIISATEDGGNALAGLSFVPARAMDNLKTKPGTLDFDIRRRTFHLGPLSDVGKIYLLACPLNPRAPPPHDPTVDATNRASSAMSKDDTELVIQYIIEILHGVIGSASGVGTLNPYSNVGLKTELVGSVVTPKVSSAGYKFSGAQHRMLQQDIIDNWQILIRRSKGSLRATVPMFVCNKYGQDVPISLTDARDADSFGRALQGYFDGKSVASVSFAMAHNVFHQGGDYTMLAERTELYALFRDQDLKKVFVFRQAGQPDLGNFQAGACAVFFQEILNVRNLHLKNTFNTGDSVPLESHHWQGYNGAKVVWRHNARAFAMAGGAFTNGVAIDKPVKPADAVPHRKARQEASETTVQDQLRGELETVVRDGNKHFRLEYILTMRLDGFSDGDRNMRTVVDHGLLPVAQSFAAAGKEWRKMLCRIPTRTFPSVLTTLTRPLFAAIRCIIDREIVVGRKAKVGVQAAEIISILERAIGYLYTGQIAKFLAAASKAYGIVPNIERCGLPFFNPKVMMILKGEIALHAWPKNKEQNNTFCFSFLASIRSRWGKETAIMLQHQSEYDLAALRRKQGLARLNVDDQARRVVVTMIYDVSKEVYNHVHAGLNAEDKSNVQQLNLPDGRSDANLEKADQLERRWRSLFVWRDLPLTAKFSLHGMRHIAQALGHVEVPLTTRPQVTTFVRVATSMIALARQRQEFEPGSDNSLAKKLGALPKYLCALPDEDSVPGVSMFNLVAAPNAPWILQLGTLIRYLIDSNNAAEEPWQSLVHMLATHLGNHRADFIPGTHRTKGTKFSPTYKKFTGVLTEDGYATSRGLTSALITIPDTHPAGKGTLSGGTVDTLGFTLPFGEAAPQPFLRSKAAFLRSRPPHTRPTWEVIFATLNLRKPAHCVYVAYAVIWALRTPPLCMPSKQKDPAKRVLSEPPPNSESRLTFYIAYFVAALLVIENPYLRPCPIKGGPTFTHVAGLHLNIIVNMELFETLGLGKATEKYCASRFPMTEDLWTVTDERWFKERWAKMKGMWEGEEYQAVLQLVGFPKREAVEILAQHKMGEKNDSDSD